MDNIKKRLDRLSDKQKEILIHKMIERGVHNIDFPMLKVDRDKESYSTSYSQKEIWYLEQHCPNSSMLNLPSVLELSGFIDLNALEASFTQLVRNNEILRTVFQEHNGIPVQVIKDVGELHFSIETVGDLEVDKINELVSEEIMKPFNLFTGPLFRVRIFRFSNKKLILILTMHHIIADGWSLNNVTKKVMGIYNSIINREKTSKNANDLQYVDYSTWHNEWHQKIIWRKDLEFWKNKLDGASHDIELPLDHPRPPQRTYMGSKTMFSIPEDISYKLKELAKMNDSTVFMILFSAYNILLYLLSGQKDILVGTPVAGRSNAKLEEMLGCFINTVVLRTVLDENTTYLELLQNIKRTSIEAFSRQSLPYALLKKEIFGFDGGNQPSSIQTYFAFQNTESYEVSLPGLEVKTLEFDRKASIYDIVLCLWESNGLKGFIEYNTDILDSETIDMLIDSYKEILIQIVQEPNLKLSEFEIVSKKAISDLSQNDNSTFDFDENESIISKFKEIVQKNKSKKAIVFKDKSINYEELSCLIDEYCKTLRMFDVRRNDTIAIFMDQSINQIAAMFAIMKDGGAYLFIESNLPLKRIMTILDESKTRLVFTKNGVLSISDFYSQIQGKKEKYNIVRTAKRDQITDLNNMSIPNRSLINYEKYQGYIGQAMVKNTIVIQGTRGCPYHCTFCHKIWPKNHVKRSAQNIFNEIELYYEMGIKRFVFVDDIFNLDIENSRNFFQLVIESKIDIQIFFPNGVRGDILTKDYIDLMIDAGVVNLGIALESASPRLQNVIQKHIDIEKLKENINYIITRYPQVILELFTMHGFPTESIEEARMTIDFIKSLKWVHFPYLHIVKIYPGSDIATFALENGVSIYEIEDSANLAYHELPNTLPFPKHFTQEIQTEFLHDYFLSRERLIHLLPYQMKVLTEDELISKYNSYLPNRIDSFEELLVLVGIKREELGSVSFVEENYGIVKKFNDKLSIAFPRLQKNDDALKVLFLDLSQYFSNHDKTMLYDVVEAPLGLIYLMTHLEDVFQGKINGKIAKSRIDFDSLNELIDLINEFMPDVICIRSLTYYREFFHNIVATVKQYASDVPIIAGGPYATSNCNQVLEDQNIDLVIIGEGELTLEEVISEIIDNNGELPNTDRLRSIDGIVFRESIKNTRLSESVSLDSHLFTNKVITNSNERLPNLSDTAYVLYTSGTTGVANGVMISHMNVLNLIKGLEHEIYSQYNDELRVALVAPLSFDASVQQVFASLLLGHTLYIVPEEIRMNGNKLVDFFNMHSIDITDGTPSHLEIMSKSVDNDMNILNVKHMIIGGDILTYDMINEFSRRYNTKSLKITNIYGLTECCVDSMCHHIDKLNMFGTGKVSIGKPMLNQYIYILSKGKKILPHGVVGEIYIGGKNLGKGYLNNIELTEKRYIANPYNNSSTIYKTGDLGKMNHDGTVEFIGRYDHQVKVRGYRIELGEIESKLQELEYVISNVVIVRKDDSGMKDILAFIVSNQAIIPSIVKSQLSKVLPKYMIPNAIIEVEKIPVLSNGKVDRVALQKYKEPRKSSRIDLKFYDDRLTSEMKLIWMKLFAEKDIKLDDDFFDLGGHSLKATNLINLIYKRLNVKLPLSDLFKQPTIRGLVSCIKQMKRVEYSPIKKANMCEYYPISAAQKRIFVSSQLSPNKLTYNLPFFLLVEGDLSISRLEESFRKVIKRHDSLRTHFEIKGNSIVQCINDEFDFSVRYDTNHELCEIDKLILEFLKPFDLGKILLPRVSVVNINKNQHLLMIDLHHIIVDAISVNNILKEMIKFYQGEVLPIPELQYKDYVMWHQKRLKSREYLNKEEFWLSLLKEKPPKLGLGKYKSYNSNDHKSGHVSRDIDGDFYEEIQSFISSSNVTLFAMILSTYSILIHKYTGIEDIVIGSPVAGRDHPDLSEVVGMFVNMISLRNCPKPTESYNNFLERVKKCTVLALENSECQFDVLMGKLDDKNSDIGKPLFEVAFSLQNTELIDIEVEGLKFTSYEYNIKMPKFDLLLLAVEDHDRLRLTLEYSTKIFSPIEATDFFSNLIGVMKNVILNSSARISNIELLNPIDNQERSEIDDITFNF